MDREAAIAEVDWYRTLVRRRIERWGVTLPPKARAMLTENMDEVAARKSSLQFKPDREGYYIGEVDEEGLRQGYGIYTRTAKKPDRWTMQALRIGLSRLPPLPGRRIFQRRETQGQRHDWLFALGGGHQHQTTTI